MLVRETRVDVKRLQSNSPIGVGTGPWVPSSLWIKTLERVMQADGTLSSWKEPGPSGVTLTVTPLSWSAHSWPPG